LAHPDLLLPLASMDDPLEQAPATTGQAPGGRPGPVTAPTGGDTGRGQVGGCIY